MLNWQSVGDTPQGSGVYRAAVPGGWLVLVENDAPVVPGPMNPPTPHPDRSPALTFYPDPQHQWSGA